MDFVIGLLHSLFPHCTWNDSSHILPSPCGSGTTVSLEGIDSSVILSSLWNVVGVTLFIKRWSKSNVQSIYEVRIYVPCVTGFHSRLARQGTLSPPMFLVKLITRYAWMSTVALCYFFKSNRVILINFILMFIWITCIFMKIY